LVLAGDVMYDNEEIEKVTEDVKQHLKLEQRDIYHRDEFELHTVHERMTDSGLRRMLLMEACSSV